MGIRLFCLLLLFTSTLHLQQAEARKLFEACESVFPNPAFRAKSKVASVDFPWPWGWRKRQHRANKRARKRTMRYTKGSARKTMGARKRKGSKYKKASRKGFGKANQKAAPKKRTGCPD